MQEMNVIARIQNDYVSKFGIPRQSGIVESLLSKIVFEPEYRNPDALRGLEGFSHLWLIWEFSENVGKGSKNTNWSPTVRPPRLGGNTRMGVFATRSPFRPNPIGLSCVKLERIELHTEDGPVLYVSGADMMTQTPIYDIKPYLPHSDMKSDATGGFAKELQDYILHVTDEGKELEKIPKNKRDSLIQILEQDPRPSYQNDPERIYGMSFAGFEVKFKVDENGLNIIHIE